jgi:hypothetical protein
MTRQQLKQELKQELKRLSDDSNFPAADDKRSRGRSFERLIHSLLEAEGLSPNSSFRPDGEEISPPWVASLPSPLKSSPPLAFLTSGEPHQ